MGDPLSLPSNKMTPRRIVLAVVLVCGLKSSEAKELEYSSTPLADVAEGRTSFTQPTDQADVGAAVRSLRGYVATKRVGVTKYTGGSSFKDILERFVLGWLMFPFSIALLLVNEQNHARMASLIGRAK